VTIDQSVLRASLVIGALEAKIRRYLAPDGCKIRSGKAHFPSSELREKANSNINRHKTFKLRGNLEIFNIYRRVLTYIDQIRNIFEFGQRQT
jgi:hypothetical protein